MTNIDPQVVSGFGDEWSRFDQSELSSEELEELFNSYFNIFPWKDLPSDAVGFDLGCGSGRWAKLVAPRVGKLHLIDPSEALEVAKSNLKGLSNCEFHKAEVSDIPLADSSCDFGYSLGVLHHIPDTEAGLRACVARLKPGAPFLLYLYYAFDNRPAWFRAVWKVSDLIRSFVSSLPHSGRYAVSQLFAVTVYWPLARAAWLLEKLGVNIGNLPLSQYRNASFYTMRTDALDRFGTSLEKRFTRAGILEMMQRCGMVDIVFSEKEPFWCACGFRSPN